MSFIANDLSVYNCFDKYDDFMKELIGLVKILNSNSVLKDNFYITNSFSTLKIDESHYIYKLLCKSEYRNLAPLLRNWLDRSVHWNDFRAHNDDDYFEYNGQNVTDQGLGECSRRLLMNKRTISFSFGDKFCSDILSVKQGLPEEPLGNIDVNNIWVIDKIKSTFKDLRGNPKSWSDVLAYVKQDYPTLNFSNKLLEQISIQPFNLGIYDRFLDLCGALDEIVISRGSDGTFTPHTNELIEKYFHGDKAWFSDESDADKRGFKDDLKFYPPDIDEKKTYTYHGKIKIEQIRVYIDWPLKPEQTSIDIVYFGPKITKK